MHKRFVMVSAAALALAAASHTATAQLATPKPTIGVLGGLNLATLGGSDLNGVSVSNRTGFQAGMFLTLHMNNAWSIEPEALYTQQGGSFDGMTLNLNYIQVPVLLRWDVMSHNPVHPFFIAGPAAAFQVGCSGSQSGQSETCD